MDAMKLKPAIEALKAGRAVIFPTDTVYGLGVAVHFAESLQEIYDLKKRSAGKPVAWLVGGLDDLDRYGANVTTQTRALAKEGWPGALTVIVKASDNVSPTFRSAQGTIGLRMPANDIALALIAAVGPIAASSANISGDPVPLTFAEIPLSMRSRVAAVIESDGEGSGVASTVIDATGLAPAILRP